LLLHLQPPARRPRFVQARFFLGDQALEVVRNNLRPRLKAILGEPAHWQHELAGGDNVLKTSAPVAQRTPRELAAALVVLAPSDVAAAVEHAAGGFCARLL